MAASRDESPQITELKKLLLAFSDVVVNIRKTKWNILFDADGAANIHQVSNKANLDFVKEITVKAMNAKSVEDLVEISYALYSKELEEQRSRAGFLSKFANYVKSTVKNWAGYPDHVIEKYVHAVRYIIISRLISVPELNKKINEILEDLRTRDKDIATLLSAEKDKAKRTEYTQEQESVKQKWLAILEVREKVNKGAKTPYQIFFTDLVQHYDDRGLNEATFEEFEQNVTTDNPKRLLDTITKVLKAYQGLEVAGEQLIQDRNASGQEAEVEPSHEECTSPPAITVEEAKIPPPPIPTSVAPQPSVPPAIVVEPKQEPSLYTVAFPPLPPSKQSTLPTAESLLADDDADWGLPPPKKAKPKPNPATFFKAEKETSANPGAGRRKSPRGHVPARRRDDVLYEGPKH